MEIDLQDLASLEDYLTITDYGKGTVRRSERSPHSQMRGSLAA